MLLRVAGEKDWQYNIWGQGKGSVSVVAHYHLCTLILATKLQRVKETQIKSIHRKKHECKDDNVKGVEWNPYFLNILFKSIYTFDYFYAAIPHSKLSPFSSIPHTHTILIKKY